MKIQVNHELKGGLDIQTLVGLAYSKGYRREDPRKAWTYNETKQCLRWLIAKVVEEAFTPKPPATQEARKPSLAKASVMLGKMMPKADK